MREQVLKELLRLVAKVSKEDLAIEAGTKFSELGINSLAYIRLLVMVENEFSIHIEEDVVKKGVESFETIEKFADYIVAVKVE